MIFWCTPSGAWFCHPSTYSSSSMYLRRRHPEPIQVERRNAVNIIHPAPLSPFRLGLRGVVRYQLPKASILVIIWRPPCVSPRTTPTFLDLTLGGPWTRVVRCRHDLYPPPSPPVPPPLPDTLPPGMLAGGLGIVHSPPPHGEGRPPLAPRAANVSSLDWRDSSPPPPPPPSDLKPPVRAGWLLAHPSLR